MSPIGAAEAFERAPRLAERVGEGDADTVVARARAILDAMTDADLEARLFKQIGRNEPAGRTSIDFTWVHKELRPTI